MSERESYDAEAVDMFLEAVAQLIANIRKIEPDRTTCLIALDEIISNKIGFKPELALIPEDASPEARGVVQIRNRFGKRLDKILGQDNLPASGDQQS